MFRSGGPSSFELAFISLRCVKSINYPCGILVSFYIHVNEAIIIRGQSAQENKAVNWKKVLSGNSSLRKSNHFSAWTSDFSCIFTCGDAMCI